MLTKFDLRNPNFDLGTLIMTNFELNQTKMLTNQLTFEQVKKKKVQYNKKCPVLLYRSIYSERLHIIS